jgi:hypothetical protein
MPVTGSECFTLDMNGTAIGPDQPQHHSHRGAFARAVLPKKTINVSLPHIEGKVLNSCYRPESFGQILNLKNGLQACAGLYCKLTSPGADSCESNGALAETE